MYDDTDDVAAEARKYLNRTDAARARKANAEQRMAAGEHELSVRSQTPQAVRHDGSSMTADGMEVRA